MNVQNLMSRWGDQSPEQILARASLWLPGWISVLLVIALAWYLARLAWLLYPVPTEVAWVPPGAVVAGSRAMAGDSPAEAYKDLQEAHLFGVAGAEPVEPQQQDALDAPDTRLNLSLRATVATADPKSAHAIIADGSGKEQAYFLRDSVPGGATLNQVYPDRVILNRGGVLEALRLPREFTGDMSSAPASRRDLARASPSVQQVIQENASSFTDIVRPQPFMPNGQLKGYRVYPGRNRQQFAALGLRPGDLVTEINGMALNNPAEGMQIFQGLGDSTQVTVTIERNGESQVLTLDTSQLPQSDDGATQ